MIEIIYFNLLHKIKFADDLPSAICKLTRLEKIDLSYNRIRQLPNEFNQLRNLKILLLTNNHMTTFPVAVAELRQLDMIDLSHNKIKELPSDLTSLKVGLIKV